jgi:CubicO group peptidase (beta-lactamase class C family)
LKAVRSVLVSVDGRTVIAHYQSRRAGEFAHVWSVTKSVLSILVGIAVDEGRLRMDQTLPELLPRNAAEMTEQQRSITLRHLLTMTSGLAMMSMPSGPAGVLDFSTEDAAAEILRYGSLDDPGNRFEYSTRARTWSPRRCERRLIGRSWTMRRKSCSTRSA